jgi:hypothetical protein
MSESVLAIIFTAFSITNLGVLGLVVKMSRDIGRINGNVKRHAEILKHCPLCPKEDKV